MAQDRGGLSCWTLTSRSLWPTGKPHCRHSSQNEGLKLRDSKGGQGKQPCAHFPQGWQGAHFPQGWQARRSPARPGSAHLPYDFEQPHSRDLGKWGAVSSCFPRGPGGQIRQMPVNTIRSVRQAARTHHRGTPRHTTTEAGEDQPTVQDGRDAWGSLPCDWNGAALWEVWQVPEPSQLQREGPLRASVHWARTEGVSLGSAPTRDGPDPKPGIQEAPGRRDLSAAGK